MPRKFAVEVHGKGYLLEFESGQSPQRAGFYTCYGIEADNVEAAVEIAADRVRSSPTLNEMIRNPADDSPMIYTETIYELHDDDELDEWNRGFAFYDDPDCQENEAA